MDKKWQIIAANLVLVLLGVVVWLVLPGKEPEPVYHGRPLSFWLQGHLSGYRTMVNGNNYPYEDDAAEAEAALGTNCLPVLIRLAAAKDSAITIYALPWAQKFRLTGKDRLSSKDQNYQAYNGFRVLGSRASSAVPALIKIINESAKTEPALTRWHFAARDLGCIDEPAAPAVPALVRAINLDVGSRVVAIDTLGEIHAEPELVIPVLIRCSRLDNDGDCVQAAIRALGKYGPSAKSAIPRLYEIIKSQPYWYGEALDALRLIDPDHPVDVKKYPKLPLDVGG